MHVVPGLSRLPGVSAHPSWIFVVVVVVVVFVCFNSHLELLRLTNPLLNCRIRLSTTCECNKKSQFQQAMGLKAGELR